MVVRYCLYCGEMFFPKYIHQKFCSNNHRIRMKCGLVKVKKTKTICKCCGKEFEGNKQKEFCSNSCGKRYRRRGCISDSNFEAKTMSPAISNEERAAMYVSKHCSKFEYVSGYTGSDGFANIRCKECGYVFFHSMIALRKNGNRTECKSCIDMKAELVHCEKDALRQRIIEMNNMMREINERQKYEERESKKVTHVCPECGKEFTNYKKRSVYCSSECSRKSNNRSHDRRLSKCSKRDYSITLKRLFDRDKGICHICGCNCDYGDGYQADITFIAGDNYPSIDHVIAIANGGQHTWENVKLAHRKCNNIKNDSVYFEIQGQMRFM